MTHHRPAPRSLRRRLLLATAIAVALLGGAAPAAQADWACAAIGDPLDLGVCVDDPLPDRLPGL